MKKLISIILIINILTLFGCSEKAKVPTSKTETETTAAETETESETEAESSVCASAPATVYGNEDLDEARKLIRELRAKLWSPICDENTTANTNQPVFKVNISLFYENLETGFSLSYRSDYSRGAASLIKTPLALSILECAESERENKTDDGIYSEYGLNHNYTYKLSDYVAGTGAIQYMPEGTSFTNYSLLSYMITDSDCIALSQIAKYYGFDELHSLADRIDLDGMYRTTAEMSCRDGGKVIKELYSFYKSGAVYGQKLFDLMANSEEKIISHAALGDDVVIARKYGHDNDGLHDMALVMRDSPYSLTIMTNYNLVSNNEYEYLYDIVRTVDKINEYAAAMSEAGNTEINLK